MGTDFSSPIDIGLAATPFGVPDELYDEFSRIYNAIKILQQKFGTYNGLEVLDPTKYISQLTPAFADSIQIQRMQAILATATATISPGEFVNLFLSGGVLSIRKADAAAGITKRAWGWAPNGIANAALGIVYLQGGYNDGYGGLTVGSTYYCSGSTPGGISTTAASASGTIKQEVGIALSASDLYVRLSTPIINP
jgi:hypothetical protein